MGASLGEDEIGQGQGMDQVRERMGPQRGGQWLGGPALEEAWGAWPCVTILPTPMSPFLAGTCEVSGVEPAGRWRVGGVMSLLFGNGRYLRGL